MASVDVMARMAVAVAVAVMLKGEDMLAAACVMTEAAGEEVSLVMTSMLVAAEVILVDAATSSEADEAN